MQKLLIDISIFLSILVTDSNDIVIKIIKIDQVATLLVNARKVCFLRYVFTYNLQLKIKIYSSNKCSPRSTIDSLILCEIATFSPTNSSFYRLYFFYVLLPSMQKKIIRFFALYEKY
ncbi:hypothetical protein VCHA38O206_60143 [Vibrio chagasii]|nr:hypothetical protein VCHA35P150_20365 [Vibrio chagasii]CAH7379256.1 hypothetical protein VCHA38O206_60143 [Vibrio chagasii]